MCLANVIFYLAGTSRQWFDNNEDTFTDWTVFRNSLKNTFCRAADRKREAESLLLTRAQRIGESSESYIQDVLSLCRNVNPSMAEDEKVAHLMKGIAEDLYQILSSQEYETTDAFVKRCRHIEILRRRRIVRPRFQRLPNVSAVSTETDADYLRSLVRTIVREELQKIMPEVQDYREEVMEALAPITGARRDKTTPQRSVPTRPQARREITNRPTPQRRTDLWRTDNNVPLCYHYGRPRHVLRYCQERRRIFENARATRTINPRRDVYADSLASFDDDYAQPNSSRIRSISPYPRRSLNRRESHSPARRSKGRSGRKSSDVHHSEVKREHHLYRGNGQCVKALFDSGSNYFVISEELRRQLNAPMFIENGPILKTACGKTVAASGRCVLKMDLNGTVKPFEFLVFPQCSHQMILGWDFFRASDAVIDCGNKELQLAEILPYNSGSKESDCSLIAASDYLIESNSTRQICALNSQVQEADGAMLVRSTILRYEKELSIPALVVDIENGYCKVWITNCSRQTELIPKGMNIGCLTTIANDAICSLSDKERERSQGHKSRKRATREKLREILDSDLTNTEKEELLSLLEEFSDIFHFKGTLRKSGCSSVRHKIDTGDNTPIKQRRTVYQPLKNARLPRRCSGC
ncbi:uncharacterized protein LOC129956639 [Argiope bruennichi]|uniref:uncharacterized protein LOC129956639 n=1 Tax=Argiope bruennichi TaxID=94029 RepID=UPI002493DEA9|nr:uncharacterized protein LOC129956639 [Argiope bruennichi]